MEKHASCLCPVVCRVKKLWATLVGQILLEDLPVRSPRQVRMLWVAMVTGRISIAWPLGTVKEFSYRAADLRFLSA